MPEPLEAQGKLKLRFPTPDFKVGVSHSRRGLAGERVHARSHKFKTNLPFAGDAAPSGLGAIKFPLAGGLFSQLRKIWAGPRRLQFRIAYISRGIHLNFYYDAKRALDCGQRFR